MHRSQRRARECTAACAALHHYARWMQECESVIGGRPITAIALPGTHDSGAYDVTTASPLTSDAPVRTRVVLAFTASLRSTPVIFLAQLLQLSIVMHVYMEVANTPRRTCSAAREAAFCGVQ